MRLYPEVNVAVVVNKICLYMGKLIRDMKSIQSILIRVVNGELVPASAINLYIFELFTQMLF